MIVTKPHNESFCFRYNSTVIVEQVTNGSYPPCDYRIQIKASFTPKMTNDKGWCKTNISGRIIQKQKRKIVTNGT